MHDGWNSYFKFNCKHAICNSHHLRDLTSINEEEKQNWAKDLIDLLISIKSVADRRTPIHFKLDPAEIKDFEERYDHIIEVGKLENPPPIISNSQGLIKKCGKGGRMRWFSQDVIRLPIRRITFTTPRLSAPAQARQQLYADGKHAEIITQAEACLPKDEAGNFVADREIWR